MPHPAPLAVFQTTLPVSLAAYSLAGRRPGLAIIDEVNGFCTPGCGPLAPPAPSPPVARMVDETNRLARRFVAAGWPVLASRDSHDPARPEPPYPPHCLKGGGDDQLVPELAWLENESLATVLDKDCINFFVGCIQPDGGNRLLDWLKATGVDTLIVTGICTDICVMDFVLTLLSARNHGLTSALQDIVVYEPGCATYDLPHDVALALELPPTAAHPQAAAHHAGLYMMASRGAILASQLS